MVLPAATAQQMAKSFRSGILPAQLYAVIAVVVETCLSTKKTLVLVPVFWSPPRALPSLPPHDCLFVAYFWLKNEVIPQADQA